jgi:hypothetical protein
MEREPGALRVRDDHPPMLSPALTRGPIVVMALLALLPDRANAGPPFLTDDPEPVDRGGWEIDIASLGAWTHTDRTSTAPHAEFNYGAATDLQLHLQISLVADHPYGQVAQYGYGDTELGVKWRFFDESGWCPQVSVYPNIELPTGNHRLGLGSGETQLFLPLWAQKSVGAWTTYGGGGYWINPGVGNRNYVFVGWELQCQISDALMLGAELYHDTASVVGGESQTGFNLGGTLALTAIVRLLFSGGHTVAGEAISTFYAGVQLTF